MELNFDQLVPKDPTMRILRTNWVSKIKLKADGTVERLIAKYIAKGFNQIAGRDFSETFLLVVKPCTIRLVLAVQNI